MSAPLRTAAILAVVLTCTSACRTGSSEAPPAAAGASSPRVQLVADAPDRPESIEITGVSGRLLGELRGRELSDEQWTALVRVSVDGAETVGGEPLAMVGSYEVTESGIRFRPRFPFDAGREYHVVFDPRRLPGAGASGDVIRATVTLPAAEAAAPARVVEVYPTTPELPENQLRLYIAFSAPMSTSSALEHVRLLDEAGQPVEAPFLPVDVALWNADRTRFTLLFDPGRVKTGILTHERMGRAMIRGRKYTLVIDRAWRDARGNMLVADYHRPIVAGPPDTRPLDPYAWRIEAPAAGSRAPLAATFPEPLDYALLHRALVVADAEGRPVDGAISVERGETAWRFTPAAAWRAGDYTLTALPILEDGAGNQIGRAFEVHASDKGDGADEPRAVTLRFSTAPSSRPPAARR